MIDFKSRTYRAILEAMLARVPNSLDKREGSMIQTALGAGLTPWRSSIWN